MTSNPVRDDPDELSAEGAAAYATLMERLQGVGDANPEVALDHSGRNNDRMTDAITRNEFQAELRAMRSDMAAAQAELRADLAQMQRSLVEAISKVAEGNAETRAEFAELRGEVRAELGNIRGEMGSLRGDLRGEMGELRGQVAGLKTVTNWTFAIVTIGIAAISAGIALAQWLK